MNAAEITIELSHYTGTEGYTRFGIGKAHATDGAIRMAELCNAFWLLDAIASHIPNAVKLCGKYQMQFWTLAVDAKCSAAMLSVSDGNTRKLDVQMISYTDFPLEEMKVWVGWQEIAEDDVRPVLMLPSEN
jgi:hypothetical protein